ncbi:MAG: nitroreductase family protein [Armatimonadota bacterium]|nr:nitroreductase family protein [bacterium]
MLDAIKNRRSVRFYRDTPVTDEQIEEVLKAGFCAPSAHANCKWHAVVVRDQDIKDKLGTIHRWSKIVMRAPVVIIVCVERVGFDHFWVDDAAAFMENMLIQATDMGLSTCWVGLHGLEDADHYAEAMVRDMLGLPGNFGVLGMTALGYGARFPNPREPKLMEGRVHHDKFEG